MLVGISGACVLGWLMVNLFPCGFVVGCFGWCVAFALGCFCGGFGGYCFTGGWRFVWLVSDCVFVCYCEYYVMMLC